MATNSRIEWTDATWTPIKARRKDTGKVGWHCERVSDGCKHCYSATFNQRMLPNGGTGLDFTRQARDRVDIFLDEKTLMQPLRWRKPLTVFVCSMTDLFGEFVPFDFIDRVFAVMALTPQHTFQVLTKRPERMFEYMQHIIRLAGIGPLGHRCPVWSALLNRAEQAWMNSTPDYMTKVRPMLLDRLRDHGPFADAPLPNVWLGTSVEDQVTADARIPHLLRCPAAVRFLSCEPLLGNVVLRGVRERSSSPTHTAERRVNYLTPARDGRDLGLDWVIVGGESGPNARPMHPDWARSIRDQVNGCPAVPLSRVGKKAAGRLLDGVEHNGMPLLNPQP
jgi:protein gp37